MGRPKAKPAPAAAPPAPTGSDIARRLVTALEEARVARIREARARTPQPTYQQIAFEVGCSISTVYNVLTGRTHGA